MAFATGAARWRALVTRDANANGHFIYSVRSTKIYCRPTCPGRLARRANVDFYENAFQAEAAGFRPCKRCKPNTVLEDPQEQVVKKACMMIDEALRKDDPETFKLQELAKKVGLTPRYFHKIFKDKTGMTPKEYAKHKSSAHGSPDTTSLATEGSVSLWDWDLFDFSNLIDNGKDSSQAIAIDYSSNFNHEAVTDFDADFEGTGLLEPWCTDMYEAGSFANSLISTGPYVTILSSTPPIPSFDPATVLQDPDSIATVSTFDLDAAAVLDLEYLADPLSI